MKRILCFLICSLYFSLGSSYAQNEIACGTDGSLAELFNPAETHGIYLPAQGDLRILVVFARFKDDVSPHNEWPAGSDPVAYATWIDPTMQTGSTNLENFTYYYNEMSRGAYRVTGTAVSVETPQDRSYYIPQGQVWPNRFLANREVLQQKVDPLVNFADFDSWTFNSNYNHTNQPDGTVDRIVMIWRGFAFAGHWGGEASLGYGGSFTVENGTKTIATGFRGFGQAGSGVTIHYSGAAFRKYNLHSSVHEVAHWLLGGPHPYLSEGPRHALWGMLGTSYAWGISANTYERERLGWIQATEAVEWASLSDFITTGVAYKYHPSDGEANEYYYFENHQKVSIYDDAGDNSGDKGIWVIHQRDVYNESHNIRVKPQDGYWNWENPSYNTTCFPGFSVPVFKKVSINRTTGLSNRDKLPKSPSGIDWMIAYIDQNGNELCGGFLGGAAPFYGAFNTTKNNVFSTWSNPTAATWAGTQENFAMQVLSQSGSALDVWFYTFGDAASAPPSKPQHVRITNTDYEPIHVAWDANIEPDIWYYEVWRREIIEPSPWEMIGTTSSTTYTDNDYIWLPSGNADLEYKIRVRDNQSNVSVFSDIAFVEGEPMQKGGEEELELVVSTPSEFDLRQNYPNPFNPSTEIAFALPEPGFVRIMVSDILGREIISLAKSEYPAGYHSITWRGVDATGAPVSSGMYFCRIAVTGSGGTVFDKVIRMILQK